MAKRSSRKDRRQRTHQGHPFGVAALRIVVGGLFVGHGAQKLFGAFDGPGLDAAGSGFEQMGLRPGRQLAALGSATEIGGGSLLALGAATPWAAAGLTGVMATAIDRVHRPNGIWNSNGGFEYNAVLIAALFALTDAGPGKLSIDHLRGRERHGLGWAMTQLAVGLGGFAALKTLLERGALPGSAGTGAAASSGAAGSEHDGAVGRDAGSEGEQTSQKAAS